MGDIKYKAASYRLRHTRKYETKKNKNRLESQLQEFNTRRVWQGLRTITVRADHSLVYELYHFDTSATNISILANTSIPANATEICSYIRELHALTVSEHDMRRTFKVSECEEGSGPRQYPL